MAYLFPTYLFYQDDETEPETHQLGSITEEGSLDSVDEPDTSSFTAFLYSLLSSSKSETNSNPDGQKENQEGSGKPASDSIAIKESSGKRSLFSKGKQSIGRALYQAARLGGYRNQASGNKGNSDMTISGGNNSIVVEDVDIPVKMMSESVDLDNLPEISEPSLLLTEKTRSTLYHALPVLVQGRNWVLLYRYNHKSIESICQILPINQSFFWDLFGSFSKFASSFDVLFWFLQHMEARHFTCYAVQEKHALSWSKYAGNLFLDNCASC